MHLQLRLIVHEFGAFFVFKRFVRVAFSTSDFALAFFRFFFQLRKEYLINNIVVSGNNTMIRKINNSSSGNDNAAIALFSSSSSVCLSNATSSWDLSVANSEQE